MKRAGLSLLLAVLLVLPAACSAEGEPQDTVDEQTEADAGQALEGAAEEAPAEAPEEVARENPVAAPADATVVVTGTMPAPLSPAEATQTAEARPTLSPEQEALIRNFQPPTKGFDTAPITIYEFSDYL